jgi:hypothetical protein
VTKKSYVGVTKRSMEKRWRDHICLAFDRRKRSKFRKYSFQNAIKKHGTDCWKHVILQDGIETIEDAFSAEVFWIEKMATLVPNGYNETTGGRGIPLTEEGKIRHRLATKEALARPDIRQRYLDGIRKSHSTPEFLAKNRLAQKIAQNRPDVIEKKRKKMKQFCDSDKFISPVARCVEQLTKDGLFLASFNSATEAAKATGTNYVHLCEVARGKRKYSGGFSWRYLDKDREIK